MCSLSMIEWSKIQKKNEMQKFLTFHYFGRTGDEVLTVGGQFPTEPAGATLLKSLEEKFGLAFEVEVLSDRELVEDEAVRSVIDIVAVQQVLYLFAHRVREGDATRVFLQKRLYLSREKTYMGDEQLAVFLLPLMSVRLYIAIFQVRLQMGSFMKKHPKEEPGIEIAVDADFMERMTRMWPTIITQLRCPLASDMKMHLMEIQVVVHPIHSLGWQVV